MDYRAVRLVREDAANAWNRRRDVTFDCDDAKRVVEVIDALETAERERDEARAMLDEARRKSADADAVRESLLSMVRQLDGASEGTFDAEAIERVLGTCVWDDQLTVVKADTVLSWMSRIADRDAWKAKAEARPDISQEDARLMECVRAQVLLCDLSDETVASISSGPVDWRAVRRAVNEAVDRVFDALRAHASKAVR